MKIIVQMLLTLTLIGVISGGLLSRINNWASPKIAEHRRIETEKAIYVVQPSASGYKTQTDSDYEIYKVQNNKDEEFGYAIVLNGSGFQGNIRMMIGINKELNKISGIKILEQVETPGLGTKIGEEFFTNQFKDLNASGDIIAVKGAEPANPNEIQAITGATISSKAVVRIINQALKELKMKDTEEEKP